jgi:hypothetical protein
MSPSSYEQIAESYRAQGLALVDFSGYSNGNRVLFAAIWTRPDGDKKEQEETGPPVADNSQGDESNSQGDESNLASNDAGPAPSAGPSQPDADIPQGRRVALVIGVGAYRAVPALVNPPRDAAAIARELQGLGFEVAHLDDVDKKSMQKALQDFEDKSAGAEVALVYFAGHGIEVNGVNYLIPSDAELARASSIDDDAVSLPRVLLAVEHAHLRIVLLDACRNNPFPMVSANGKRALSRGLSRVEPSDSTVIVFAAKEGTTADDGAGKNSPFATALVANLKKPGIEIGMMFRAVTEDVKRETGGAQQPFVYASLGANAVYLAGKPAQ